MNITKSSVIKYKIHLQMSNFGSRKFVHKFEVILEGLFGAQTS